MTNWPPKEREMKQIATFASNFCKDTYTKVLVYMDNPEWLIYFPRPEELQQPPYISTIYTIQNKKIKLIVGKECIKKCGP